MRVKRKGWWLQVVSLLVVFSLAATSVLAAPGGKMNTGRGQGPGKAKPWKEKAAVEFRDAGQHWAMENIRAMSLLGAINGYPDGSFKPEEPVKVQEALKMVVSLLSEEGAAGQGEAAELQGLLESRFKNVDTWAQVYAGQAIRMGLMPSTGMELLNGNKPAKRYEVAVWLVGALGLEPDTGMAQAGLPFNDTPAIPAWARGYIALALQEGLLEGYPDNTFRPNQPVKRGEMATLLGRFAARRQLVAGFQVITGTVTGVDLGAPSITVALRVYGRLHEKDDDEEDEKSVSEAVYEDEDEKESVSEAVYGEVKVVPAKSVPLDPDAFIYLDGARAELGDIQAGYWATIITDKEGLGILVSARTQAPPGPRWPMGPGMGRPGHGRNQ